MVDLDGINVGTKYSKQPYFFFHWLDMLKHPFFHGKEVVRHPTEKTVEKMAV